MAFSSAQHAVPPLMLFWPMSGDQSLDIFDRMCDVVQAHFGGGQGRSNVHLSKSSDMRVWSQVIAGHICGKDVISPTVASLGRSYIIHNSGGYLFVGTVGTPNVRP